MLLQRRRGVPAEGHSLRVDQYLHEGVPDGPAGIPSWPQEPCLAIPTGVPDVPMLLSSAVW